MSVLSFLGPSFRSHEGLGASQAAAGLPSSTEKPWDSSGLHHVCSSWTSNFKGSQVKIYKWFQNVSECFIDIKDHPSMFDVIDVPIADPKPGSRSQTWATKNGAAFGKRSLQGPCFHCRISDGNSTARLTACAQKPLVWKPPGHFCRCFHQELMMVDGGQNSDHLTRINHISKEIKTKNWMIQEFQEFQEKHEPYFFQDFPRNN